MDSVMASDCWQAAPSDARWYGEVIGSAPGEDIDYVYGYSADEDEPSIDDLIPDGWLVDETTVKPTPGNPMWLCSDDS